MTFEQWLNVVDKTIARYTGGLSHLDLPDACYRDAYEEDPSYDHAVEMAEYVLEEEGL